MGIAALEAVLANRPVGLSLDDFESVVDELSAVQRRRDEKLEAARALLDYSLDTPAQIKSLWQEVIRKPSVVLHEFRSMFEDVFRERLEVIDFTAKILPAAESLAGAPLDRAEKLPAAQAELKAFADMILGRWTSQEELEELMAETFELPSWLTNGPIPPHLRPPQSWYDETIDPTKPADA